jgi:hypothetical protein
MSPLNRAEQLCEILLIENGELNLDVTQPRVGRACTVVRREPQSYQYERVSAQPGEAREPSTRSRFTEILNHVQIKKSQTKPTILFCIMFHVEQSAAPYGKIEARS